MLQITNDQLQSILQYEDLIPALKEAFCSDITTPLRHHHNYKNPKEGIDSTLLFMPSWEAGKYLGIKIVTVSPNNSKYKIPSIQGQYLLFDAHKGNPLALMDAKLLTNLRTAAASALASRFLSRKNSKSLLMIGTGALAPFLIKAHASVRPIEKVYIWGRSVEKAQAVATQLPVHQFSVHAIENIESILPKVDIISAATMSQKPLVFGKYLQKGQHIDLVGSYQPNMREADDETIQKASIYVDTFEGATKETGDIVIPLQKGIIQEKDIRADLFDLCKKDKFVRQSDSEITLFKSVGHALEDLAAAKLVYEKLQK